MKTFLKPYWVYLTTLVPVAVLFALYGSAYQVIHTLLSKQNVVAWASFGGSLATITFAYCAYAFWCQRKGRDLPARFGFFLVAGYVIFTYVFMYNRGLVIPLNVPRWMLFEGDLILYVFTFLMPAMAYGLLLAVIAVTPEGKKYRTPFNIGILVAIPIFWYIMFTGVMPMFSRYWDGNVAMHFVTVLFIATTLLFLACLVRLMYLILMHRDLTSRGVVIGGRALILLVLPILCFIVNNGLDAMSGGVFGDFSHPAFYVFAVLNGLAFLVPEFNSRFGRLALFFLRSVLYTVVVYFFLVLLPFFPLSVLAILAFGFGFLMLTPIAVMILTTDSMIEDMRYLGKTISPLAVVPVFLIGLAVIPSSVVTGFSNDKANLQAVLRYVFEPSYENASIGSVDVGAFTKTLEAIKSNKEMRGRRPHKRKPYLSPFYEWFVLENLTLSDRKLIRLDRIFTDTTDIREGRRTDDARIPTLNPPRVVGFDVDSKSAEDGDYTETWVNLEIQNGEIDSTEFSTKFVLPEGCWVDNYYLDIEGRREYGLLAEKKSATWIYQQITTRERRDPGILFYTKGENTLILRVFPFASQEKRRTGFRLLHHSDITFSLDETTISAKALSEPIATEIFETEKGFAIPQATKAKLPLVTRDPVYVFIIDCSKSTAGTEDAVVAKVHGFVDESSVDVEKVEFRFTNYASTPASNKGNWEKEYRSFPKTGGLFLERALKAELLANFLSKSSKVPIFIVVTDSYDDAVFIEGFSNWGISFPDSPRFFVLDAPRQLSQASYNSPSRLSATEPSALNPRSVRAWPDSANIDVFLPDNGQMTIVPKPGETVLMGGWNSGNKWDKGLALRIAEKTLALNPSDLDAKWLVIVKGSLQTNILTGFTSFISLENEAQKQALLKKQKQVLNANKALDIGEEHRMSEPPFWIVLSLLGAALWFSKRLRSTRKAI